MDAHHLIEGRGEHPEGVGVAQIVLLREGEPAQVVEGADIIRGDVDGLPAFALEGDGGPEAGQLLAEAEELQLAPLLEVHAFMLRVPDHGHTSLAVNALARNQRPRRPACT